MLRPSFVLPKPRPMACRSLVLQHCHSKARCSRVLTRLGMVHLSEFGEICYLLGLIMLVLTDPGYTGDGTPCYRLSPAQHLCACKVVIASPSHSHSHKHLGTSHMVEEMQCQLQHRRQHSSITVPSLARFKQPTVRAGQVLMRRDVRAMNPALMGATVRDAPHCMRSNAHRQHLCSTHLCGMRQEPSCEAASESHGRGQPCCW